MGKLRLLEVQVLVAGVLSLIASCVLISSAKHFWNDELYSWYLIADPSFSHMWEAFNDKINNTPPLYFLLGWGWAQVAGASELSLRLFSSLGFCAAMVLMWATLRKAYGFWPSCLGTFVVFLSSEIVLMQNAEARMYGLFLAVCAAAVYQYVALNARAHYTATHLIRVAVVHATLVHTHLFGPLYSGALLVAYALEDLRHRRLRKGIYIAIVAGWLSFLAYLPAFLVQADAGKPRAWMPKPRLSDFFELVGLASSSFAYVIFVIVLILCLTLIYAFRDTTERGREERNVDAVAERSLLVVAFAFLAVPVATWMISRRFKPIFWDRYLVPSILSYCIILAHLTSRYVAERAMPLRALLARSNWRAGGRYVLARALLSGLVVALLVNPLLYAQQYTPRSLPGSYDGTFGHSDLPIAVQVSGAFLERWHYAPDRERYYFVLDEEAAMKAASGRFGPQEYKHMDAFKRTYPDRIGEHILQSEEFLERFDRFLVLDYSNYEDSCPSRVFGLRYAREWRQMHCPQWVEVRLLDNPDYEITHLGDIWSEAILLVERRAPSLSGSPAR